MKGGYTSDEGKIWERSVFDFLATPAEMVVPTAASVFGNNANRGVTHLNDLIILMRKSDNDF